MVSFERLREIHPDGDEELQEMKNYNGWEPVKL